MVHTNHDFRPIGLIKRACLDPHASFFLIAPPTMTTTSWIERGASSRACSKGAHSREIVTTCVRVRSMRPQRRVSRFTAPVIIIVLAASLVLLSAYTYSLGALGKPLLFVDAEPNLEARLREAPVSVDDIEPASVEHPQVTEDTIHIVDEEILPHGRVVTPHDFESYFGEELSAPLKVKIQSWHDDFERHYGFPTEMYSALTKYVLETGKLGVLDIGANVGVFTEKTRIVCADCKIAAFECMPHFATFMRDRFKNDRGISVYPFGLSNSEEPLKLYADPNNLGWNTVVESMVTQGMIKVNAKFFRLDDLHRKLIPDNIGLIKIDTEGAEWRVIEGAKKTLAALPRPKPALMIEVAWGPRHPDRDKEVAALEWLMNNGWKRQPLNCEKTCDMMFIPEDM